MTPRCWACAVVIRPAAGVVIREGVRIPVCAEHRAAMNAEPVDLVIAPLATDRQRLEAPI